MSILLSHLHIATHKTLAWKVLETGGCQCICHNETDQAKIEFSMYLFQHKLLNQHKNAAMFVVSDHLLSFISPASFALENVWYPSKFPWGVVAVLFFGGGGAASPRPRHSFPHALVRLCTGTGTPPNCRFETTQGFWVSSTFAFCCTEAHHCISTGSLQKLFPGFLLGFFFGPVCIQSGAEMLV
uniref:Uncharacterized protein n=1 Tax=Eutreptiella gymnastica TaxID=73025 RepID=A0A7S4G1V2_9EUGL